MIARILSAVRRPAPRNGALTWTPYRTGWASDQYMIVVNRGGGVLVSYRGALLNDGRMLPDVPYAQAYCEGHAAAIDHLHRRNGLDMLTSARNSIPADLED